MNPPTPNCVAVDDGLRQMVLLPRESDGVGSALRHIFSGVPGLPSELNALLVRLNKDD